MALASPFIRSIDHEPICVVVRTCWKKRISVSFMGMGCAEGKQRVKSLFLVFGVFVVCVVKPLRKLQGG